MLEGDDDSELMRHLGVLASAEELGGGAVLFEDERMRAETDERLLAIVIARHRQAGAVTPEAIMAAMTDTERELAAEVLRRRAAFDEDASGD